MLTTVSALHCGNFTSFEAPCLVYRNCCNKFRKNEHDALTSADVGSVVKRNVLLVTGCRNNLTSAGGNSEIKNDGKQHAFEILSLALEDIDLAIVDIGASVQSLAIVETLSQRKPAPPVIALVEGDDANAMSALHRHGAAACWRFPAR